MVRLTSASLLAALCLAAASCSDSATPTPTPVSTTITNSFSGALTPNGAASHPFTTAGSGAVTATVISLAADNAPQVGLSLGTWSSNACQIVVANDKAVVGTVVTGSASGAGQLCVRIYDVGSLIGPLTYELQVVHP